MEKLVGEEQCDPTEEKGMEYEVITCTYPSFNEEYVSCKQYKRHSENKKKLHVATCQVFMVQIMIKTCFGMRLEQLSLPLFDCKSSICPETDMYGCTLYAKSMFRGRLRIKGISMKIEIKDYGCTQTKMEVIRDKNSCEMCYMYISDASLNGLESIFIDFHEKEKEKLYCPLYPKHAQIQNLCGSCTITTAEISFNCYEKIVKKKGKRKQDEINRGASLLYASRDSVSEAISSTGCTFVLGTNNRQVDFRGARSIQSVEEDWQTLSGIPFPDVVVNVYMVVLKGHIGKTIYFDDRCLYLASKIDDWCQWTVSYDDVCHSFIMNSINWKRLFASDILDPATETSLQAKAINVDISRRGGVVFRYIFTKDSTWNMKMENEVVYDCNRLLNILHHYLNGK